MNDIVSDAQVKGRIHTYNTLTFMLSKNMHIHDVLMFIFIPPASTTKQKCFVLYFEERIYFFIHLYLLVIPSCR